MSGREVMLTPVGEMMDMISCLAVYNGTAEEKEKTKKMSFDEFIAVR